MISEITSQVIACAPACAEAATVSKPRMAQAVNSTRSNRPSTLRSLAFSLASTGFSAMGMALASAISGPPGSADMWQSA